MPVVYKTLLFGCLTALFLLQCQSPENNGPQQAAQGPATNHFNLISPEQSGLRFVPKIQEDFRYNFTMDPYIYNGGGVAVIDVDNDGLQDLFFTARLQESRLYRNKGQLTFEDISEKAGILKQIGLKTGVTVVDINADGWQDLYVCRTWLQPIPERRNLLYINQGKNTAGEWMGFIEKAAEAGIDDLSPSQQGNFFDYDLDGDLDLYLMNHPVDFKGISNVDFNPTAACASARCQAPRDQYESDRLYQNDGKGHFTDVSQKAGIWNRAFGLSVHSADFNEDGYPDIFVGNDFIMPDFLYINNQKGGFQEQSDQWFQHTSNHSMGADMADINNDGLQDLVVLDMLAADWTRRRSLMSTMIPAQYNNLVRKGYGHQNMRNTLQLNHGRQGFSEVGCLAGIEATDWSWAPLLADLDNDGNRDLFIANGIQRDLNDADFFLFTADSINRTGGINPQRFGNFENFVKMIPSHPVRNYIFQNNGQFPFVDVSESWGITNQQCSNGAAYADLDNDGDLELITNNLGTAPSLYENKATDFNQNHWLQLKCKGPANNPMGIGARVRVYAGEQLVFAQEMTNVRGYYSSVEPIWQVGLGTNKQVSRIEISWPNRQYQVLTNIPANQRLILDISNATQKTPKPVPSSAPIFHNSPEKIPFRHLENEFDDFTRERLLPQKYSTQGPCMAVADIDSDGQEDLFIGGAAGQSGAVFLQKNGKWVVKEQAALKADQAFEDTGACWLDADQDGDADLYVVSGGNEAPATDPQYQDRLYLNDGKGNLSRPLNTLPAENSSGSAVRAFDYDKDGDLDLFVAGRISPGEYPKAPLSMVLQNDRGQFKDQTQQVAPQWARAGMVTDIQFADLNQDGQIEFISCGEWMALTIYSYDGKQFIDKTADFGLANSAGWWNCLLVSDLDQDGDLDIAAGNEGLNSRFRATEKGPVQLWANDFDHNGSMDAILGLSCNGSYYPAAQRNEMAAQMPSLLQKKYSRYGSYAKASLQDILPAAEMKQGLHLQANELASGWFENKGGTFVFHAFPMMAQTAPIRCLLVGDFNQDQQVDLIGVGNHFGKEVETGRLDALNGVFLSGPKGQFKEIPQQRSGFWLNGEARSMARTGKFIIIGRNNDTPLLLEVN